MPTMWRVPALAWAVHVAVRRPRIWTPARPAGWAGSAASADQLYRLFRSRLPFYHEADVRLRAGDAPPEALAKELLRLLREDWLVLAERRKLFP